MSQQISDPVRLAFGDFDNELNNTRTLLQRLPDDKLGWRPHDKSFTLGDLADHVARLSWFVEIAVKQDEYDLANWQRPAAPTSAKQILATFEERAAAAQAALKQLQPDKLLDQWTLRAGDKVLVSLPRVAVIRTFAMSHIIHHRAQLTVYLRILNVAVPGLYGPSADEQ